MGTCGHDIPYETQFLLIEVPDSFQLSEDNKDGEERTGSVIYTVLLPILEGDFRAGLQGNANDELEICLESGIKKSFLSSFSWVVFKYAFFV